MKTLFEQLKSRCANFKEICATNGITEKNAESFREMLNFPIDYTEGRFVLVDPRTLWNGTSETRYIPLDEGIVDVIVEFNRHGFETEYCCEGHVRNDGRYTDGYIKFAAMNADKKKTLENALLPLATKGLFITIELNEDKPVFRFNSNSCLFDSFDNAHVQILDIILQAAKNIQQTDCGEYFDKEQCV